jgi:hypothetical protein
VVWRSVYPSCVRWTTEPGPIGFVVIPAALAQLQLVPYAILYARQAIRTAPPGSDGQLFSGARYDGSRVPSVRDSAGQGGGVPRREGIRLPAGYDVDPYSGTRLLYRPCGLELGDPLPNRVGHQALAEGRAR